MSKVRLTVLSLVLVSASLVAGATGISSVPRWIIALMGVYVPQTTVVRDPLYADQFYFCWEGRNNQRYGMRFVGQSLQDSLQTMSPGERKPLSRVFTPAAGAWSARDNQVCSSR